MYNVGKNWIHDLIFKHKFRKKKMIHKPDLTEAKFYHSGMSYCKVGNIKQICIANKIMHYSDNLTIDF